MGSCFFCRAEVPLVDGKISFREECQNCSRDLHICKNCRFYDPSAYRECRESSADIVKHKEKANFCEYFQFNESGHEQNSEKSSQALKSAAEALFKK